MKSNVSHDLAADYSCYYSFLQENFDQMNDSTHRQQQGTKAEVSEADNGGDGGGERGGVTKGYKEIITSLRLLDEQENSNKDDQEEDKTMFEAKHKKKPKEILDFQNEYHEYDVVLDQSNRNRKRKSPSIASAVNANDVDGDLNLSTSGGGGGGAGERAAVAGGGGPQRRLWVKNRSKDWWDKCNSVDFPEEDFRKAFRMGKDTFEMICNELTSVVAKENTMLRDAVPVRQRVAVCIWRLATGEPLRLVSRRFGLGISTCHKLVLEVCLAIKNVLMPKYLQWPNEKSISLIKNEFESISGIPNVVGSMYTTHIPIIAPKTNVAAYYNKRHTERNQKTSYSITVQGVVDPRGVFTDVCIGWPGSMADDQVLEKSAIYHRADGGLLKGVWIVGSSGYPLMDWVLVPYKQPHLTWTQHAFNEKIEEISRISKNAFARLKGRWCCLQKRTEVKLQDLPVVLGACCVLHSICEMRDEKIDPELMVEVMDDEMVPEVALRSAMAMKARDSIAHNLLHHNHAATSFL